MSGVKIPANAAARDVRRMREENLDLEGQILVLRTKQLENSEMMGQLSHIAEWVDEQPEHPVEEPEPEHPVEEPEPEIPAEEIEHEPDPGHPIEEPESEEGQP